MKKIQFPQLPSLQRAVRGLEDNIIVMSGPALAISGIIAGIDLVTGGTILKNSPNLGMFWAICLLLTLDFQVLSLGVRFKRIYRRPYPGARGLMRKGLELLLCVAVAGGISYVSIQMQSVVARANVDAHTSVQQAEAALNINGEALIWERSTLVLVLIFMSGLSRDSENREDDQQALAPAPQIQLVTTDDLSKALQAMNEANAQRLDALQNALLTLPQRLPAPVPAPQPFSLDTLETLLQRLDALNAQRIETAYERITERVTISLQEVTAQIPAIVATRMIEAPQSEQKALPSPADRTLESTVENALVNLQPIYGKQFESKEAAIRETVKENPSASAREIAALVGCTEKTAQKWLNTIQKERQESEQQSA